MARRCMVLIGVLVACGGDDDPPPPPSCGPGAFAAGDDEGHPAPLGAGAGEARAGRVRAQDLPDVASGLVTWKAGDFVLANDRIALVIEDVGDSDLYDPWGGRPVGLARVAGGTLIEPNNFGELFLLTGRSTVVTDSVSVIADGSDGKPAIIRARGKLFPLPFFEALIGTVFRDSYEGVDAAIDYELAPGSEHVDVRYRHAAPDERSVPSVLHALMYTKRTPLMQPGKGFDDQLQQAPYVALVDDGVTSWAYAPGTGVLGASISSSGFVGAFADGFTIPACTATERLHAQIVIGGPGLDGVVGAVARTRGETQREVTGMVTRAGVPQAGVRVHALDSAGGYLTRTTTSATGSYALHVPATASVELTAFRRGDGVVTAEAGAALALPVTGAIHVTASEGATRVPVRVQILPPDDEGESSAEGPRRGDRSGAGISRLVDERSESSAEGPRRLDRSGERIPRLVDPRNDPQRNVDQLAGGLDRWGEGSRGADDAAIPERLVDDAAIPELPARFGETPAVSGRLHVEYAVTGEVMLTAPPGRWKVVVSRGYEYELVQETVTVVAGATVEVDAAMIRSVATPQVQCGDFHVHTWRSNDSGDVALTKVAQAVADGVELPVRSDHEWVADFTQEIAQLDVGAFATGFGSVELTSFEVWGHMGVFPLTPDPAAVNAGAPRWQAFPTPERPDVKLETLAPPSVFDAVRARREAPLVIINHPRGGANYFDYVGFHPETGLVDSVSDWDTKFTLVEVFNDSGWKQNRDGSVADWLGLLRAGRKVFAVGSSDSHGIATSPVGYPRTCIAVGTDDPRQLTPNGVRDQLGAGHATVSGGIYVSARLGTAAPGDTTTGAGSPQQIDVTVQAASWVDVTSIEVIVDGVTVDTIPVMPGDAEPDTAVRWHAPITVQTRATGGFVVIAAYGTKALEPVHPGRIPFGVTEPIFVTP